MARVQGLIPKGLQSEEIQNLYVFNALMSWASDEINPVRLAQMTISEFLHNRKRPIDNEGQPLLRALIFDQFEEIFTLYQDRWNDRNEFFEQVRDALKDDSRLLRVIFTIREDYIAQLDPYAPLLPEKLRTRYRMEQLRRDAALSAVTGPLRETKRFFAKCVAEKLVEELLKTRVEAITSDNIGKTIEVTGEFVEPVQLQVVCQNLWQELPPDVTEINEQHLLEFGDVDRQLSRFYEAAVKAAAEQTGTNEEKLRQWCEKWLITSTDTRNIVHRGPQQTEGIPNTALDILADRHLINLEWRAGARWYELTHDRFIEPIRASNETWNKQRGKKVNQASLMIRQAEQSITMEKYERALDAARNALDLSEEAGDLQGEANALFSLGKAYEGQKQYDEALTNYVKALEIVKQTDVWELEAYLLESQGFIFGQMKKYEQAVQCYTDYINLLPDDSFGYYNRGVVYSSLKEYGRAIADYDRVLELDPKNVNAYHGRGNAYSNLKEYERAIADYGRVLELDPKYSNVYYMRGLTYLWLRDIKQAQIDLKRSWQLDSTNVNFGWVVEWANMCLEKPDLETAGRLEAIAVNDPNNFVAYVCRGVALWIRGSFVEATTELDRAIPLNPELEDIFFWKGMVHAYLGQDDEAIAAIEKSLELDLPPILLSPLRWIEQDRSAFYQKYAAPLLARLEV